MTERRSHLLKSAPAVAAFGLLALLVALSDGSISVRCPDGCSVRGVYSTTVAFSIRTASRGTSPMPPWWPVGTWAIASTTSIPSTTLPNTA